MGRDRESEIECGEEGGDVGRAFWEKNGGMSVGHVCKC